MQISSLPNVIISKVFEYLLADEIRNLTQCNREIYNTICGLSFLKEIVYKYDDNILGFYTACSRHSKTLQFLEVDGMDDPCAWICTWPKRVILTRVTTPYTPLNPYDITDTVDLTFLDPHIYQHGRDLQINPIKFPKLQKLTVSEGYTNIETLRMLLPQVLIVVE